MIWVKRIVPIFLIVALVMGWNSIARQRRAAAEEELIRCARATARVWVARARFREAPEPFEIYRDEALEKEGLTLGELRQYVELFEQQPLGATRFSRLVTFYVDSLVVAAGHGD